MAERILLMSGDPDWRESLTIALDKIGADSRETEAGRPRWRDVVTAYRPTAVVLQTANPGQDVAPEQRAAEVERLVRSLAEACPKLALLLVTAVPDLRLSDLAFAGETIGLIYNDDGDPDKVAAQIVHESLRLRPVAEPPPPGSEGIIEVLLSDGSIECHVQAGAHSDKIGPIVWDRRDAMLVNQELEEFEDDDNLFKSHVDRRYLESTSNRLLWHSFERPLKQAREWCDQHMVKGGTLYHRFTVSDGDLEFVPFELVASGNPGEYLRAVQPLARKLKVAQPYGDPDRACSRRKEGEARILFILSDVKGSLSLPDRKFKKQDEASFGKLDHLEKEFDKTVESYGERNVTKLPLAVGVDAKEAIGDALRAGCYDVVHFAGHSIRADASKEVFLMLPGMRDRALVAYNTEDFARRVADAGVRLVILSSCEGASCRAISRLASFGVPAVAGFRWKVDDRDAASFTSALHRALSRDRATPLVKAFHEALQTLKESTQELTWFSPVLMLQPTMWHEFKIEV